MTNTIALLANVLRLGSARALTNDSAQGSEIEEDSVLKYEP